MTLYYDAEKTTVTDQASRSRKSEVDALGRLSKVTEDPNGLNYQTSYTYDVLDNLRTVVQGGQTRTFVYDTVSRLTSAANPESGTATYQYDNNGNLTQKTDARSITTTYTYDGLNRVKTCSYSDGTPTVTYTYDASGVAHAKGRLTQVSSSVSVYDYPAYDALGRVTRSTQTTDGQTYAMRYVYNRAGQMTSQTYPSGRTVTTSYDVAGRLSTVTGNKTGEAAKNYASNFQYAAHGAVGAKQLGNGLWEHTFFNTRLQPIEIGLGAASTASDKLKLEYGYGTTNNNGNVQSQTITAPGLTFAQSYTYDQLNRLHMAQENNEVWKQSYPYDQYGNRRIDAANTTANVLPQWNPTVDAATNRFTTGQGYSYDLAGNLITDAAGHTYAYDAENRQKSYDTGQASYSYDGEGRRVKKYFNNVTTIFVYNVSGQLVAEYTINGVVETNGTRYVTSDTLGSPRIITDKDGVVKARHDYLPFGEELWVGRSSQHRYVIDTVRQKFTGKERDIETGLDYFLARYYSSTMGRFTSPDEFTGGPDELYYFVDDAAGNPTFYADLRNPQSLNKYQYAYNNPLRYIDLNGHEADDLDPDQQDRTAPISRPPFPLRPMTSEELEAHRKAFEELNKAIDKAIQEVKDYFKPPSNNDVPSIRVPPLVTPSSQQQVQPQITTPPNTGAQPMAPPPPVEAKHTKGKRKSTEDKHTNPRPGRESARPPNFRPREKPHDWPKGVPFNKENIERYIQGARKKKDFKDPQTQ